MFSVYRTLSLRQLQRRRMRAVLIVASIALGVAALVATRALNDTMSRAAQASSNPMAGVVDFIVSRGELTLPRQLVQELEIVPGVKSARARIFRKARLPDLQKDVMVIGLDFLGILKDLNPRDHDFLKISQETINRYIFIQGSQVFAPAALRQIPVVVGKTLDDEIPPRTMFLRVQKDVRAPLRKLVYAGPLEAHDKFAMFGGYTLLLDLANAAEILDMKSDEVNRIDVVMDPSANHDEVRRGLEKCLGDRAFLSTPEEHSHAHQSAMSGMQTGFSLCGAAALVVGLFLVYNTLAITTAERRHEIGILLSLGATRQQVRSLFMGEASVLGLCGALLGLPLGYGLACLGLQPMQQVVGDIFGEVHAPTLEITPWLLISAVSAGVGTATGAALKSALEAARENPAEAVRRAAKAPTLRRRLIPIVVSLSMVLTGLLFILLREQLPSRAGTYGGLILVLLGALVASPFFADVVARMLQPIARRFFSLEWRLAADNLVNSRRTGLVIGALAAGVSLVMQTTGTINSNKRALREWIQESFASDLVITAGGPLSAGQTLDMEESLAGELGKLPQVDAVVPFRMVKVPYRATQIALMAIDAHDSAQMEKQRMPSARNADLIARLHTEPDSVIASENFAALYSVGTGDTVTLAGELGPVHLKVIGVIVDYSWNHGSLLVDRRDFKRHWKDDKVTVFDVYLKKGVDVHLAAELVNKRFGAQHQLFAATHEEVQSQVDSAIERLYGIAYAQQLVVMAVAALGVITALLISVMQRQREIGLLRAIGASRAHVIRSVLAEACLMGVIGTIIGLLVAIPLQWYILQVVFLEESGYVFPVYIPWTGGLFIAVAALVTATLAGLGPALHAVRQRIPEAIAYE